MGCAEQILSGDPMNALLLSLAFWPGTWLVPDAAVEIRAFQFDRPIVEVPPGTKVVWTNQDQIEHTVTAGAPDSVLVDFGGTLAGKRSTFGVTFARAGTYRYFCARHTFMRGEIRVLTPNDGAR
jgi:plastocyanin